MTVKPTYLPGETDPTLSRARLNVTPGNLLITACLVVLSVSIAGDRFTDFLHRYNDAIVTAILYTAPIVALTAVVGFIWLLRVYRRNQASLQEYESSVRELAADTALYFAESAAHMKRRNPNKIHLVKDAEDLAKAWQSYHTGLTQTRPKERRKVPRVSRRVALDKAQKSA